MTHTLTRARIAPGLILGVLLVPGFAAGDIAVDLTGYRADCGVQVVERPVGEGQGISVEWPLTDDPGDAAHPDAAESGRLVLDLRPGRPLFGYLAIVPHRVRADPPVRSAGAPLK